MSKDKPIGDVARSLMTFGLNIAESQIQKRVDDPEILKGVQTLLPLIREIISELNDDDPNNKEQVKATMAAWTNGPLADYLETILDELVSKIDSEHERSLVLFVGGAVIDLLRIVTDLNPDNVEQIRNFYLSKEFLTVAKDEILENAVWPILDKKGVSPEIRNLMFVIIGEVLTFIAKERKG